MGMTYQRMVLTKTHEGLSSGTHVDIAMTDDEEDPCILVDELDYACGYLWYPPSTPVYLPADKLGLLRPVKSRAQVVPAVNSKQRRHRRKAALRSLGVETG